MSVFFTGQALQTCWHRHTQTSHKVKTVFQYAHGFIYTVAVAVKIKQKNTQIHRKNT